MLLIVCWFLQVLSIFHVLFPVNLQLSTSRLWFLPLQSSAAWSLQWPDVHSSLDHHKPYVSFMVNRRRCFAAEQFWFSKCSVFHPFAHHMDSDSTVTETKQPTYSRHAENLNPLQTVVPNSEYKMKVSLPQYGSCWMCPPWELKPFDWMNWK